MGNDLSGLIDQLIDAERLSQMRNIMMFQFDQDFRMSGAEQSWNVVVGRTLGQFISGYFGYTDINDRKTKRRRLYGLCCDRCRPAQVTVAERLTSRTSVMRSQIPGSLSATSMAVMMLTLL